MTHDESMTTAQQLRQAVASSHIAVADLTGIVRKTFTHAGLSENDAAIATDVVVHASMHGSDAHGLVTMPLYIIGLLDGTIKGKPDIKVTQTLPTCLLIDADQALGLVVSHKAMGHAIELAQKLGLGAVAVRRSSHFGAASYYVEMAAKAGLIGFAFTNASPAIAPTGSKEALFGTNPIGAGFPLPESEPIIADLATSIVARSRIRAMLALGQTSIPEGWALDPEGKPTADPAIAVKGSLLPIGGAKGYALALMVELLCSALSDATPGFDVTYENMVKRPSGVSQFFLAINPEGFAGTERYGERAGHIAETVRNAKPVDQAVAPRLPGARSQAAARKSLSEGVAVTNNIRHALNAVADLLEQRC